MLQRLPLAAGEAWDFRSPCIEDEGTWRATVRSVPLLDRLIARQRAPRRARAAPAGRGGATALHHVMAAADPVDAVAGGTDWSADAALREYARRTRGVSEASVRAALAHEPDAEAGRAALREVCGAVGVGLILGGTVVRLCDERNVWLQRDGAGYSAVPWCRGPVAAASARALLAERGAARAADPGIKMRELREVAESFGIERPLPRSKQALSRLVAERLRV